MYIWNQLDGLTLCLVLSLSAMLFFAHGVSGLWAKNRQAGGNGNEDFFSYECSSRRSAQQPLHPSADGLTLRSTVGQIQMFSPSQPLPLYFHRFRSPSLLGFAHKPPLSFYPVKEEGGVLNKRYVYYRRILNEVWERERGRGIGMRKPSCEQQSKSGEAVNRGAWSKQEDQKLIDFIREHGEGCWRSLPRAAGTSTHAYTYAEMINSIFSSSSNTVVFSSRKEAMWHTHTHTHITNQHELTVRVGWLRAFSF